MNILSLVWSPTQERWTCHAGLRLTQLAEDFHLPFAHRVSEPRASVWPSCWRSLVEPPRTLC